MPNSADKSARHDEESEVEQDDSSRMSDPELDDLGLAMPEFRVPSKGGSEAKNDAAAPVDDGADIASPTAETKETLAPNARKAPENGDAEGFGPDATMNVAPEELEKGLEQDSRDSGESEAFDRAELVKTVRMDAFDRASVEGSPSWEVSEYLNDQRFAPDVLVQPPRVLTKKWQEGATVRPNGTPAGNDRSEFATTVRTTIPDGSFEEELDELEEIDESDDGLELELDSEVLEESEIRPPPKPRGEESAPEEPAVDEPAEAAGSPEPAASAQPATSAEPVEQGAVVEGEEPERQRPGRVRRNTGPLRRPQSTPVSVEEKADDDMSGIVQELLDEKKAEEQKQPEQQRKAPQRRPDDKRTNWFLDVFGEEYFRTLPSDLAKVTEREVRFMHQSLGLQKGARVLDLACGFGRHAVELAKREYEVAGLDISMAMLQRALSDAQRHNLSIKFIHGDMRELNFQEIFDACINWQTSFGYFDDRTNVRVAKGIARSLKPGGRLLLDVVNRDYVVAEMPSRTWWEGHECVFLEEVEFDNHTSILHTKRSFIYEDGSPPREFSSYIRLYSLHELRQLLAFSGFRLIEVSGEVFHRGSFLGPSSPRLILLAEKHVRE